jgi:hypothetical protein
MEHERDPRQTSRALWRCTECGEAGGTIPEPGLDPAYGTARCLSSVCKGRRRIFKEVNRDISPNPPS